MSEAEQVIPPMSEAEVEHFVSILENPHASDAAKALANHLVDTYFRSGAAAAGEEWMLIRARDDLEAFTRYVFGYIPAAHHRIILDVLQDDTRKRTVIVAPPLSAKSEYTSLIFPAFRMGKYPDTANMLLMEGTSQTEKITSQLRPLVKGSNEWGRRFLKVFPETKADEDAGWTREKLYLANRTRAIKDPNLFAVGFGSKAIQGSRADFILLDDIIGDETVRSETEMGKVRDKMHNLIIPRLHTDGRVVAIMTRWGANDLAPTFLKELGFEMVYMPALGEEEDPSPTQKARGAFVDLIPTQYHLKEPGPTDKVKKAQWEKHPEPKDYVRQQLKDTLTKYMAEGKRCEVTQSRPNMSLPCVRVFLHEDNDPVLWPEMFSYNNLMSKKEAKPVSFRLVFMGDPTGITGDVFKREWFRFYGEDETFARPPRKLRKYMTVDPSAGDSEDADYFVATVVGIDEFNNKFILDHRRAHINTTQQPQEIKDLFGEHPEIEVILIDSQNYQVALFHSLANDGYPAEKYKTNKNKEAKLEASAIFYKQRKVFLPKHAEWVEKFIDEFTQFPRGRHDDQIDALANLWEYLILWEEPEESEEESTVQFGTYT